MTTSYFNQSGRALVFTDSRQFGRVRFHHGREEPDWWNTAVPEIISPEFDQHFVDQFLDRHRKAPIKAVLLLQSRFSGIGNWMADEILGGQSSATEANRQINPEGTRRDFPCDKICREKDRLKLSAEISPIRPKIG